MCQTDKVDFSIPLSFKERTYRQPKMTGIRRLYQEMSRDEQHDLSFELERNHTMGLLLSAKNQRKNLEQEAEQRTTSKDETSKENKTSHKKKKPIPKQSPKMASAKNAYMGAAASKKSSKKSTVKD